LPWLLVAMWSLVCRLRACWQHMRTGSRTQKLSVG
jgi:hypothetical protein